MRILLLLLDKEFRQFFRNPFLPKMVVGFTIMIMLVIPWVTTMDVRHIGVSVVDNDRTPTSRRLIRKIDASDSFTLADVSDRYDRSFARLETGDVDVIVEIPEHFERSLAGGSPKKLRITANAVNPLKSSIGMQYLVQSVARLLAERSAEEGLPPTAETIVVQNRYNPTLEYRHYMIPALMIMMVIMFCGFLPALNFVSEKEKGTIEQINVTPVGRSTFTLAKLIPYWIIGFGVLTVMMGLAYLVYGLWPVGSFGSIYLAAGLFILTMSGLGVTVANRSATMQQTMFLMFFFVMIFVLMSGLLTPVESMPLWAQWITRFLPPRYFVEIMRSAYLKGTTIGESGSNYIALSAFAVLFHLLAAITYKKQA